jgi:hypothetical protein
MRGVLAMGLALFVTAAPLAAQDSTAAPPPDSARAQAAAPAPAATDSVPAIRPPVSPMGAFWRSLLIPGWGQARTGRRTAAAFFLGFEGVALGMVITTSSQLNYLEETNSGSVNSKSQQREDWLVLLGVNHLISAMEAYVSAHLWDFPGDLSVQAAPGGGVSGGVSIPVRVR